MGTIAKRLVTGFSTHAEKVFFALFEIYFTGLVVGNDWVHPISIRLLDESQDLVIHMLATFWIFGLVESDLWKELSVIFVGYQDELKHKERASMFRSNYYSILRFSDAGEIAEYVEIFDLVMAARGIGMLDQLK
ncbi:hypothetical protein [Microbulbifer agarilyticus]